MKKIIALLMSLITLLSLTSCASAPKPDDKRVVLTLGGEKIYYDYFRYVFLNTKMDMDRGDENYWTENPEQLEVLKASVLETLVHNRAIQQLAKKHKIKLSKDEKASILADIEALKDADEDYKNGMKEAFLTEYSLYYINTFTTLWGKIYDHVTSPESGLIKSDDKTVKADIPINFRRIRYVLIEFTPENKAEKREAIEEVLGKAQDGVDFVHLIEEYCDDPDMVSYAEEGSYFTRGQFVSEAEVEIEKLKENEMSGVLELSAGFFIIQRLPLEDEYIEDNFSDFINMYTARIFNEMVAELEGKMKIKTSEFFDNLSIGDVK